VSRLSVTYGAIAWVGATLSLVFGPASADPGERGCGSPDDPDTVPRVSSPVRVDGVLDEPMWGTALVLELNYEVRPGENIPPPVRTEVLLSYDDDNFYAAFRCHDPEPSTICAHLSDRDHVGLEDWVALILDTFNDERRSFDFLINAVGVQSEFIETQNTSDYGWDAIWSSATRITDWGYVVELAIPFNQLRFQRTAGPQVWGFDAVRRYPRSLPHHIGAFPRDRNNNCYLCQAIKIQGFEGATPGRNVEISPTFTGLRTDAREELPDGDFRKEDEQTDLGATATWGMTPNLTFNAAVNPDFSHIEADALVLDINEPFALYYEERRPFFAEGSDFFGTLKPAIYTRTMRDPSWGLKLSGKEGVHTMGAYIVRDDVTSLIFPGSESSNSGSFDMETTAAVLRYKLDVGDRYTLGALATDREGGDYFNRLVSCDANLLLTNTDQIQLQLMGSSSQYPDDVAADFGQPGGTLEDYFLAFEYDHDARNWYWWLDYDEVGDRFRADLGFIPMVGYRNAEGGVNYSWQSRPGCWWSNVTLGNELNYFENSDGRLLGKNASVWLSYNGAHQSSIYVEGYRSRDAYNNEEFDRTGLWIEGGFNATADLRFYVWGGYGDRIDYANTRLGQRTRLNPSCAWHLGDHLRLEIDHSFERMRSADRWLYDAHASQVSGYCHFNVRSFLRVVLQYLDVRYNTDNYTFDIDPEYRHLFTQVLFSYKVNPRTVLYLGYSDNHLGTSGFDLTQNDRTFFAKLGYAWAW
jgi:hypothetical protein